MQYPSSPFLTLWKQPLGTGSGLVAACSILLLIFGCSDAPQTRSGQTQAVRKSSGKSSQPAPTGYTEMSENAAEREEAVRKVCQRKASGEIAGCWMEEVERTKNRQLQARIGLMLTISPQGRAVNVEVMSPQAELKSIEQCVADAARSWNYPEGTATALVRCEFHVRSSQ